MNLLSWILVGLAIVAAAVAIYAGNNLVVAVPVGAVAVLLASVVGAVELQSRTASIASTSGGIVRESVRDRIETDSLLRLRRSFRSGEIGRSTIMATVRALERDLSPAGRTPLSFEAERQVIGLPPEQFRHWVDHRLRRIEAAT